MSNSVDSPNFCPGTVSGLASAAAAATPASIGGGSGETGFRLALAEQAT